jgi:acylphosphatase
MIAIHCTFKGRVQGMGFRCTVKSRADSLGVLGWVRNESNGTVEMVFQGDEDKVTELLEYCKNSISRVERVIRESHPIDASLDRFSIRY